MKAIPTQYNGVNFRSRLEARWASFFDSLGWGWEYEPIDLDGYIPDFILNFKTPLLVEIKPALTLDDLYKPTNKIDNSGWEHDALILGAKMFYDDDWGRPFGGIVRQTGYEDTKETIPIYDYSPALFHKCSQCENISFHHSEWRWHCYVCNAYDGDHYLGHIQMRPIWHDSEIWHHVVDDYNYINNLWKQAGNKTQWHKPR